MADITARREARRRKILENSELRLQRISGQITKDDITNNHETKYHKSNLTSILTNTNTNEISPNELVNSSWDDPMEIENEKTDANLRATVCIKKRNVTKETVCNDKGIIHSQDQIRYNTEEIHNGTPYSKQNNVSQNFIEKKNELSILTKILVNRSVYILLAAILNLMLILRVENLFGRSIIVPFMLICLSRLWITGLLNDNQRNGATNSMIFAALILCNVRPKIIYVLKKLFNIVNHLINDLAIFIFSFVFMYYIISCYWVDFDILLANKVEIIVNRHAT